MVYLVSLVCLVFPYVKFKFIVRICGIIIQIVTCIYNFERTPVSQLLLDIFNWIVYNAWDIFKSSCTRTALYTVISMKYY